MIKQIPPCHTSSTMVEAMPGLEYVWQQNGTRLLVCSNDETVDRSGRRNSEVYRATLSASDSDLVNAKLK